MFTLNFREMGYRRPTSQKSRDEILALIDREEIGANVTIDLSGCVFSYPLAVILEKIVNKMPEEGDKEIVIVHAYASAFEDHLLPYFTSRTSYLSKGISSIKDFKSELKAKYNISLIIKYVGEK